MLDGWRAHLQAGQSAFALPYVVFRQLTEKQPRRRMISIERRAYTAVCGTGALPSTTSAAGHSSRHVTPAAAKFSSTFAPRLLSARLQITVEPKPCLEGATTGGPLLSRQLIAKVSSPPAPARSRLHSTSTRPSRVVSAPYLPAFVASSCNAMPMVCAADAEIRRGGPVSAIRVPARSLK